MELTQPVDWIGKSFLGYMVNTEFSEENIQILDKLIRKIEQKYGDSVFCMPNNSLHITLLDWIAPLVDYVGQDKTNLFTQINAKYDSSMSEILSVIKPFDIHFNEIRVSPNTIFIVGQDGGEFQKIRKGFLDRVQLLPNTKLPPKIIHSSLARFTKKIDLDDVKNFMDNESLGFTQKVNEFRLIRTTKEPMLNFQILKNYRLLNSFSSAD